MRDAGCGMRDAGCGMRDAGCGMRDAGCGMRKVVVLLIACQVIFGKSLSFISNRVSRIPKHLSYTFTPFFLFILNLFGIFLYNSIWEDLAFYF
jgi:hypothetical protein